MRKILATIVLVLAVSMARASLNTFTVTVTNVPLPGSGTNLTVLGVTRNWTNAASAFGIQTNSAGVNESATNLFRSWSSFPQLGVTVYMAGTNAVNFRGLDLTLSQGGTWASVVSNSVASSNLYGLMLPFANLPAIVRTNQANEIANAIRNYSTNATFQVSTNFNLLDSATFIWGQSAVTNISGYPTNLANSQISSSAAIARSKLASGTANHVLINDGSGVPSSEAQLSLSRGGTGVTLSDPGTNSFLIWDDSVNSNRFATIGTGLSYSGGVVSSGLAATNTVWVSKSGSDSTGIRGDMGRPFLTLGAAKTNAVSGDTIFVLPGTYDEKNLLKDGVNWHFFNGAIVVYTGSNAGSIFDDTSVGANGPVTCAITGHGQFGNTGTSLANYGLRSQDNSTITLECTSLNGVEGAVLLTGSVTNNITIIGATILGPFNHPVWINNSENGLTLNRCTLLMQNTYDSGAAIHFYNPNTNTILRDCVLIGNAAATNAFSINAYTNGSSLMIYGTLMSNLTNDTNVTISVGASRFEVNPSIR